MLELVNRSFTSDGAGRRGFGILHDASAYMPIHPTYPPTVGGPTGVLPFDFSIAMCQDGMRCIHTLNINCSGQRSTSPGRQRKESRARVACGKRRKNS